MHLNKKNDAEEGAELIDQATASEIDNDATGASSSFTEKTDG
jgi:hypothetical protein